MPDDERKGRRLGDETKGRIADLASGWTVDGASPPAPEVPADREPSGRTRSTTRRKVKTLPPPPPGSPERKALEDKVEELRRITGEAEPAAERSPGTSKASKAPPPVPPARSRPATPGKPRATRDPTHLDPSTLDADRTKENRGAVGVTHDRSASLTTNAASGTIGGDTPLPIFDRAAIAAGQKGAVAGERAVPASTASGSGPASTAAAAAPAATLARGTPTPGAGAEPAALAVPVGEFEPGATVLEEDKLRIAHAQSTIKRDAANALLGVAEPAPAVSKPLATSVVLQDVARRGAAAHAALGDASGASTGRFERGDDTAEGERDDATAIAAPSSRHAAAGTLRTPAALPRRRGLLGDVRYVATVVLGLRAVRRELVEIEARQATRQQSRRHHLITLGRAAVTSEGFFHPELGPAREQLTAIEEERSQHAGHVVAADAELTRVRRDREARARQFVTDRAALDAELATQVRQLEPLEKQAGGVRKRAADLYEGLRRVDARIAATEAGLAAPRSERSDKVDRAAVQAELATLRAERKAIERDEPVLAGELDALNPRIAALEAAHAEARRRRAELETAEHDDERRVEELLIAIGAKRKVVDRAAADAEALRDKILLRLGERLHVDRPDDLFPQLAPIDEIDVEIGVDDRRIMEIREIRSSVDRGKVARGVALLVLVVAALGALAGWLVLYAPT